MSDSVAEAKAAIREIATEQLSKASTTLGGSLQSNIESWTDSRSAIIELLQNADDVGANHVTIDLTSHGVRFSHDGKFLERRHVAAMCDVRQSTKDVETQTGFKGIGFKAVFLISDAPMVRQGPWSFEFKPGPLPDQDNTDPGLCWYLIPRWVEAPPSEANPSLSTDTLFWLPYSTRFDGEAQAALRTKLIDDLHAASMLFLRSVRHIHIRAGDLQRNLTKDRDAIIDAKPKKTVKRRFHTAKKRLAVPEQAKRQLPRDDPRRTVTHRDLQLAFELDNDGKLTEVQADNALYYVFLPTEEPTQLPFLVQGDFLLDTQRSKLQENNPWNRWLHEETLAFATEQLTELAANPTYTTSYLSIIPTKGAAGHRDTDKHLLQPLYARIADLPLLRSYDGTMASPSQACMAAEEVTKLVDAQWLLDNKKRLHFVPEHEGHILKFKAYGTESLSIADAVQGIFRPENRKWLEGRKVEWFSAFYAFLTKHVFGAKSQALANQLPNLAGLAIPTNAGLQPPIGVFLQPANPAIADLMARLPECPLVPKEHMTHAEVLVKLGVHFPQLDTLCKKLILTAGVKPQSDHWAEDQYEAALGLLNEWWRGTGGEPDEEARLAMRATRGDFRLRTNQGPQPAKFCFISSPVMDAFAVPLLRSKPDWLGMLRDLGATTAPRLTPGTKFPQSYTDSIKARHGSPPTGYPLNNNGWHPWPDESTPQDVRSRLFDLLLEEPKSVDGLSAWKSTKANLGYRVVDVESFAAWQTKNTQWIPSNQGLRRAGEPLVWPEDKTSTRLARGILPIVQPPGAWRTGQKDRVKPFLVACNIHLEPSLDTLLEILCQVDAVPEEWKARSAAIYQEIVRLLTEGGSTPAAVAAVLDRLRVPTSNGKMADAKTLYWPDVVRADPLQDTGAIAWRPDLPRKELVRLFQFLRIRPASQDLRVTPVTQLDGDPDAGEQEALRALTNHLVAVACHHGATESEVRTKLSRLHIRRLPGPFQARVELLVHARNIELHAHVEGTHLYSTFRNPIQTAIALVQYLGIAGEAVQVIAYILQTPAQADEMLQSSGIPFVRRVQLEDSEVPVEVSTVPTPGTAQPATPRPAPSPPGAPTNGDPAAPATEPRIIVRNAPETWTPDVRPEAATGKLVNWSAPKAKVAEPGQTPAPNPPTAPPSPSKPIGPAVIIQTVADQVPDEVRRAIGKWGEAFVNEQLTKRLQAEFTGATSSVEGSDAIFRQGDSVVATIRWYNRNGESGQSPDFVLIYANGKTEYIEVKATGVQSGWAEFTSTEWQLARDHHDRFFVYRVWNAGRQEVDYSIITMVEQRWRSGEFPQYRIKLQLDSA